MSSSQPVPHVSVRGEAVITVDPEVADLGVTVRVRARDRQTALERCRARQDEVAAAVTAAGDAVEVYETTGATVYVESSRVGEGLPLATVHNRLTLARLEAVGELVSTLGRMDDVDVFGPTWRLRPDSPAVERARLTAIRDAVRRARQYAAAFGAELTDLLEVSDVGLSGGDARLAVPLAAVARFEASEPVLDLTPARQEVHGAVEVRFAMTPPDREVFRA